MKYPIYKPEFLPSLRLTRFMKTPQWQCTIGLVQSYFTINMRHGIKLHSSKQVDLCAMLAVLYLRGWRHCNKKCCVHLIRKNESHPIKYISNENGHTIKSNMDKIVTFITHNIRNVIFYMKYIFKLLLNNKAKEGIW